MISKFKVGDWVELKEAHKKYFRDGRDQTFQLKTQFRRNTAWKILGLQLDYKPNRPYIWLSEEHFELSGPVIE